MPSPQSSLVPAISATDYVDSPHDVPVAAQGSSLPTPPPPPGVFHDWQPTASKVAAPAPVAEPTDRANRKAKLAMALMVLFAGAIIAVVVLSALRISGMADLGLSNDELSSAFRREAVVWVPVVAVCSAGLAAASLLRAKLN